MKKKVSLARALKEKNRIAGRLAQSRQGDVLAELSALKKRAEELQVVNSVLDVEIDANAYGVPVRATGKR